MGDPGFFNRESKISEGVRFDQTTVLTGLSNGVDPDQTPQNAASDQGLHCLPLVQQF